MTLTEFCARQGPSKAGKMVLPDLQVQFPIEIQIPPALHSEAVYEAAAAWADNAFGSTCFVEVAYRFFFTTDSNAMQFKLAWCL